MKLIEEAMVIAWGKRCPDHADGCPVCEAWAEYDEIMEAFGDAMNDSFQLGWDHAIATIYRWLEPRDEYSADELRATWGAADETEH